MDPSGCWKSCPQIIRVVPPSIQATVQKCVGHPKRTGPGPPKQINVNYIWLVVSTHLKNIRQIGNLPQVGVKIKPPPRYFALVTPLPGFSPVLLSEKKSPPNSRTKGPKLFPWHGGWQFCFSHPGIKGMNPAGWLLGWEILPRNIPRGIHGHNNI